MKGENPAHALKKKENLYRCVTPTHSEIAFEVWPCFFQAHKERENKNKNLCFQDSHSLSLFFFLFLCAPVCLARRSKRGMLTIPLEK